VDTDGFENAFFVVFGFAAVLILLGFVFVGYSVVRGARAARRAGVDPFTPESLLIAQALEGRRPGSLEQRLAELDDLHRRGVISADEHRAARTRALGGEV
jgi:hypothetical protein